MEKQTKEMALKKARKDYERELLEIDKAFEIIEQIEPGLPEGWIAKYSIMLNIYKYGLASASEFREVCALVEAATDQKLNRVARGDENCQKLTARGGCKLETNGWLYIDIDLFEVDRSSCKVTFMQETVTKIIADPACLGIEPEKKKEA